MKRNNDIVRAGVPARSDEVWLENERLRLIARLIPTGELEKLVDEALASGKLRPLQATQSLKEVMWYAIANIEV